MWPGWVRSGQRSHTGVPPPQVHRARAGLSPAPGKAVDDSSTEHTGFSLGSRRKQDHG